LVSKGNATSGRGLLYVPAMSGRIPVEWSGLSIKKGPEGTYGCITNGEVKVQGSDGTVLNDDLKQQIMDLLTQGPGQWSGKLGDSFDAFEKIITEIEQTPSPTSDQLKKFQNIGFQVLKATDKWLEQLSKMAGNPAADNLKTKIESYIATIKSVVNKATVRKEDVLKIKTPAQELNKAFKKASTLQKILEAIKNANQNQDPTVDLTEFFTDNDGSVTACTLPVFLDKEYFPLQYRGAQGQPRPIILNLSDLSLSDDKSKIEGLNLQGSPEDVEGIWNWLGVEDFKVKRVEELATNDESSLDLLALYPALGVASTFELPAWTIGATELMTSVSILRVASSISIAALPFIVSGDTNPWKDFTFDLPAFQGGGTITYKLPRYLTNDEIAKIMKAIGAASTLYTLNSGEPTRVYQIEVLVAGNYQCSHCPGGFAHLDVGNIYKYGLSYDRLDDERYETGQGYVNTQIALRTMVRRDLGNPVPRTVALAIEKMLIIAYMVHPENINRGRNWLIRPAGNKIYR